MSDAMTPAPVASAPASDADYDSYDAYYSGLGNYDYDTLVSVKADGGPDLSGMTAICYTC